MKKAVWTYTLLLLAIFPLYAQLTLEACKEKARENYPAIKRYQLIERTEAYTLSNANKGYLPQLSLAGKASYQSEVTQIPIDIPGVSGLSKDQYSVTVDVNQSIWDGGVISAQKEVTRAGTLVDKRQTDVELYTINERVDQLFFGILLLEAQIEQNLLLQSELERNYNQIISYMENGIANQSDLDAVKVELLSARQTLVQLRSNRKEYRDMLAVMIGETIDPHTTLVKPASDLPLIAMYNVNRPELQLYDARQKQLDSQQKVITTGYLPRLGLFVTGGMGRPGLNMLENSFSPYYIGGVRLSWSFGSLYTQKNDRRKIEIAKQQVAVEEETFLYNIELDTTREYTEIRKIGEMIRYDDEIIELRANVRKAAEAKVANGTSTVTDLMREITSEDMARQDKILHEIQYLMAIYELKNTTNN